MSDLRIRFRIHDLGASEAHVSLLRVCDYPLSVADLRALLDEACQLLGADNPQVCFECPEAYEDEIEFSIWRHVNDEEKTQLEALSRAQDQANRRRWYELLKAEFEPESGT